jgi:hypothetical protein
MMNSVNGQPEPQQDLETAATDPAPGLNFLKDKSALR